MAEYTDADVARMLGWKVSGRKPAWTYDRPGMRSIGSWSAPFGLSTPPGPEVDANAARYVLPWLRGEKSEFMREVDFVLHQTIGGVGRLVMDRSVDFGPTLCRACLMVGEVANDQ